MTLFYNNQQRKMQQQKELQDMYNKNIQMQQYQQNKQNMFDKMGGAIGTAKNGYDKYRMGSTIASKFGGSGNSFGSNGGGNWGGYATAAKGAMDVGSDLQRKDYTNAGLDTAKTAASFFGPWGMAAAAAIQMYQNFRNKKQKKAQEAAMKGMEELQKSQQESNEKKAQAMQEIEQQNQQNEQEVEQMSQGHSSPDELKNELYMQTMSPQYQQSLNQYNGGALDTSQQQPVQTQAGSGDVQKSAIAQEISNQVQQPNYSNQDIPYSYEEIQQELMRRRGM